MMKRFDLCHWKIGKLVLISMLMVLLISACKPIPIPSEDVEQKVEFQEETVIFGLLLVGPVDDKGWSQAHFDSALFAEQQIPDTHLIFYDKVNAVDRPGVSAEELAQDLYDQGARIIIFSSEDMIEAAENFSKNHADVQVIHVSGDTTWKDGKHYQDIDNLTNIMGRMEYGKMIAGCAAAMTTKTGKIAYLGPLENGETYRFAASAYLGAKYCWNNFRTDTNANLEFSTEWIGFWFNIPGVTLDPTKVANSFYNAGFDVIISGIDTAEASIVASERYENGEEVYVIPFDFRGACEEVENVCIGVPYFNWGPFYTTYLENYIIGEPLNGFFMLDPDWDNMNNLQTSAIGFINGDAMDETTTAFIRVFKQELANGLNLWTGPIRLQDGTAYIAEGEIASEVDIWYLPKLLLGMRNYTSR